VGNPFAELKSLEDIGILTRANKDQEVPFTVYNISTKTLRDIVIKPNESWGGQGLIGCEFMMGLKFNIPDETIYEDIDDKVEGDDRVEENVEVEMKDDELKRHRVIEESKSKNEHENEVYGNNEISAVKEEVVGSNTKNDGQQHEGIVVGNEPVKSENDVDSNKEVLKRSIAKPNKEYNPFLDTYKPVNEESTKETMGTLNTSPSDSEIIRHTESENSKNLNFIFIKINPPKTVL
jgi:hypothetical protein